MVLSDDPSWDVGTAMLAGLGLGFIGLIFAIAFGAFILLLSDDVLEHLGVAVLFGLGLAFFGLVAAGLSHVFFGWSSPWQFYFLNGDNAAYVFPFVGFVCGTTLSLVWQEWEA